MSGSGRILVVGGLSGIGAGVVSAFRDRSLVWSRRQGVDAEDPASVADASTALLAEYGPPDALLHCVGSFVERPLLQSDPELFERLLQSNLYSAFLVARHIVPAMVEAGRGRVLFFAASGVEDHRAMRRAPLYFAAKAALVSMARSLAAEVAPGGITVNVISPGIISHRSSDHESQERMLGRVPMRRAGSVEDVVGLVSYLLSEAGSYITGQNLCVDGGLGL